MKTRFLILLLSVLVVVCLPLSSSAADVYHLDDDTQPLDVAPLEVDQATSTQPMLSQSLYSVSPLSTSSPTYWSSNDISNALARLLYIVNNTSNINTKLGDIADDYLSFIKNSASSAASRLSDTNTWLNAINTQGKTRETQLSSISMYLENINKFVDSGKNPWWSSLDPGLTWIRNDIQAVNTSVGAISTGPLVEKLTAIQGNLGFPDGSSFFFGSGSNPIHDSYGFMVRSGNNSSLVPVPWYRIVNEIYGSLSHQKEGQFHLLGSTGVDYADNWSFSLLDVNSNSFLGLASILRGPSGNHIVGSILTNDYFESGTSAPNIDANNILDALFPLFAIQNDLARLTYVQADPQTIALKKSQQGNEQALQENFTGEGKGVNPSDIGSMSGMGDSLGGLVDTGVTMDDGFTQLGNGDTWNFFSPEVAGQLNTAPSTYAADDDFVHFYDPDNKAFHDLLEQVRGGE